jgi:thioredoxin-like negative regulator of GroEL
MKRRKGFSILLASIALMAGLAACSPKKGTPVALKSSKDFCTKVFDYPKHPNIFVYAGQQPCLVEFCADTSATCKSMEPVLKEVAKSYENDILVYKLDVNKAKEVASLYNIRTLPTFLFVPMKRDPQVFAGVQTREVMIGHIDKILLGK